jgi:hypothetical protein
MENDFIAYLMKEREAEFQVQLAEAQQEALEVVVRQRFPVVPQPVVERIHDLTDTARLQQLILAVPQMGDLTEFEQQLQQALA